MPDGGRVIAGKARGIRLEAAPAGTRPLSDRVKQALFASLEAEEALSDGFLDLFAGTGAAGIEALSRGAERATFVELNAKAASLIDANLRRVGLSGGRVVRSDVGRFLAAATPIGAPFRAVFVDPPYESSLLEPALEALGTEGGNWLEPSAVIVAKHFWREEMPDSVGALRRSRQKRFGETMLSFYTRDE